MKLKGCYGGGSTPRPSPPPGVTPSPCLHPTLHPHPLLLTHGVPPVSPNTPGGVAWKVLPPPPPRCPPPPPPRLGCFYQEGTGCSRRAALPLPNLPPPSLPPPFRQPSAFTSSPLRCFNPFFSQNAAFSSPQ